ncbi:MAG: glycosyltransferase family 2 protein [Planctomycetaceae bacterium]|jgi:succinoglycan biosynthesis protein ExoA|nr:glycosyltransferase family 2 protein [Planctomycetaceae bacterium]
MSENNRFDVSFISVIVPVRNEEKHITAVLDALLAQEYPKDRFEVLVADGCSTDKTYETVRGYAERHSQIQLFLNPKKLSSAARNIGIRESHGEIIVIIDGHCLIDNPQMFANIDRAMRSSEIAALGRPQPLFLENASALQKAIALARHSRLGHHPDSFIYSDQPQRVPAISTAVVYRRAVFEQIGMFDERFDACEDCELNYRIDQAGLLCYFTPDIAVSYKPRNSIRGLFRQLYRYGRGRIRLAKKHRDSFSFKMFLPALMILGVLIGGVLSFLSPLAYWGYIAALILYMMIVGLESLRLVFINRFAAGIVLLPIIFLTIHAASGIGELAELLTPFSNKNNDV